MTIRASSWTGWALTTTPSTSGGPPVSATRGRRGSDGHDRVPGSRGDGDRIEVPRGGRRPAAPGGLRALPGAQGAEAPQLGPPAGGSGVYRLGGADSRAHRPHRLSAAALEGRVQGASLRDARDSRPPEDPASGLGSPPGGGGRLPQQAGDLEAQAGAAAVHGGGGA